MAASALGFEDVDGSAVELSADHVLAATGYRSDLRRLSFISTDLRSDVRTIAGTPWVDGRYALSAGALFHRSRRRPDLRAGHAFCLRVGPRRSYRCPPVRR